MSTGLTGPGIHGLPADSPLAAVEMRATPVTLVPKSPGCWPASAMMVMPPIEWPTSTTGMSPGATALMTRSRSAPSRSMLATPASERPDRPWSRWSQNTSRCWPRPARWKCQQSWFSV